MNVDAAEVPPPGAGLVTVTCAVPLVTRSAAGMTALKTEPLRYVVAKGMPFQFTIEAGANPVPPTFIVTACEPITALFGDNDTITGTAYFTAILIALLVPPPGAAFTTVKLPVPEVATSDAFRATCNCVALT